MNLLSKIRNAIGLGGMSREESQEERVVTVMIMGNDEQQNYYKKMLDKHGKEEVDKFRTAVEEQKDYARAFQKSEAWSNRYEESRQVVRMDDDQQSRYYQRTLATTGQQSLDELKLAVEIWRERGDAGEGLEKQLNKLEEKHEDLMEWHGALANAVLEVAIKTGIAEPDAVLEGQTVDTLITFCEKMGETPKTSSLEPDARRQTATPIEEVLLNKMADAQVTHERDELAKAIGNAAIKAGIIRPNACLTTPMLVLVCDDLAKTAKSKALESEANLKRGQKGVDELISAVKSQRSRTNGMKIG